MNIDSAQILIVAENKLVRWSLKEILAQEGFSADIAPTAGEYLKKIRNHSYHLVIVDDEVRTADDVLAKIDLISPATNIIILSTFALERKEAWLNRPNIFSVIEKPFSIGQIKSAALAALISPRAKAGREQVPS